MTVLAQVHTAKIQIFWLQRSAFSSFSNMDIFYIIPNVRVLSVPSVYWPYIVNPYIIVHYTFLLPHTKARISFGFPLLQSKSLRCISNKGAGSSQWLLPWLPSTTVWETWVHGESETKVFPQETSLNLCASLLLVPKCSQEMALYISKQPAWESIPKRKVNETSEKKVWKVDAGEKSTFVWFR